MYCKDFRLKLTKAMVKKYNYYSQNICRGGLIMSDAVTSVTNDTFGEVVEKSESLVMVDFWATWCGPCKIVAPVVEELAKEYEGKVTFVKVNTDENQDLATRFNIRGIPTLMFFKGGDVKDQVVGAVPKAQLKSKIDSLLG
jgi:thioredoxin 1